MPKLIECVPNFSTGQNPDILAKIVETIEKVQGVYVLAQEQDQDHNRAVVTVVGPPRALEEACFRAIKRATEMIDLNQHQGEHPRIGATDVCPLIPLEGATLEDCQQLAWSLGKRVAEELHIPVYFYEHATERAEHKNLAFIRRARGQLLKERILTPEGAPDLGPSQLHPTAGAIAIGVRFFLIAYNINLATSDIKIAQKIARQIRESNGGLPAVKAIGIYLTSRQLAQVSMNLVDYRQTSIEQAFQRVTELAEQHGVEVLESELIGLIPRAAWRQGAEKDLKLSNFHAGKILETQLELMKDELSRGPTIFLEKLAAPSAEIGGGGVCAFANALAAALARMGVALLATKKDDQKHTHAEMLQQLRRWQDDLNLLIKEDGKAYQAFLQARRLPKSNDEQKKTRQEAINEAMTRCVLTPLSISKHSIKILETLAQLIPTAPSYLVSDLAIALELATTAMHGAHNTIKVNFPYLQDHELKKALKNEGKHNEQKARQLQEEVKNKIKQELPDWEDLQ